MSLSSCYLFKGLADPHLEQLEAIAFKQLVQEGQWLFHKDEPADNLYILENGAIELLIEVQGSFKLPIFTIESATAEPKLKGQDSVELPTTMIKPGDGCVGIGALIEPYRYSLSARCARNGTLLVIPRSEIQRLMHQFPEVGCCVITNLSRKLLERLNETRREVQIHFMSLFRSATL
jgi:CRP-like cAMP-binding protein